MKPEILAPAGNRACLEAAVRCGADAVYLGAGDFNARRNAENFDADGLERAVEYCHARDVKVHFTENILVTDGELYSALKTAERACAAGVDAIIIQDAGLASLIRSACPSLPLHASTQMSVHDPAGVAMLKKMGFSRVIPSRELSLEELRAIALRARELDMETEVFVHSALCMSVSGQCYLSSMLGSRSGNRGLCAQPCRLPFAAPGGNGHDLSLKDMSFIGRLGELEQAGICSFKIEGRMKSAEYVAAAVSAARISRDTGSVPRELAGALAAVFSRSGFTDGYLDGKTGADMFGIRTENDEKLSSTVENSLHELYRNEYPRIRVDMSLTCRVGEPALLSAYDEAGNRVEVSGDTVTKASNLPLDAEYASQRLKKSGGTPYIVSRVATDTDGEGFLSAGSLNAMRRGLLEKLTAVRSASGTARQFRMPEIPSGQPEKISGSPRRRARFSGSLPGSLAGLDEAFLPLNALDADFVRLTRETETAGAELPRALFGRDAQVARRLRELRELGIENALCENWGAVELALEAGMKVHGGMFLGAMNSAWAAQAQRLGLASQTLSFENTLEQAREVSRTIPTGIAVYGYFPLMLTRNCPLKNGRGCAGCAGDCLTDRKNIRFFVRCRDGASELFNSLPTVIYDRPSELSGFDFLTWYFTRETPKEMAEILAGERPADATHGLYRRGVL